MFTFLESDFGLVIGFLRVDIGFLRAVFTFLESGFYKDCEYWVTLTQIFLKNDTLVSQVPGFYKDCEYWVTLARILQGLRILGHPDANIPIFC